MSRANMHPGDARTSVFISYAHADDKFRSEFETSIKPLVWGGKLDVWSDKKLQASKKWRDEIQDAMERAQIAVLLFSQSFLASDFIMNEELPFVLEAAESRSVKIMWVPLEDCLVETTPLKDVQAAWDPKRPLKPMRTRRAATWTAIARQIMELTSEFEDGPRDRRNGDDLHARLIEAIKLKFENVVCTPIPATEGCPSYLRIGQEQDGFVEHYPLLVLSAGPTQSELQNFLTEVVEPYRVDDPRMKAVVVYSAARDWTLPEEVAQFARDKRLVLSSFDEFCRPMKLDKLRLNQLERLRNDAVYPSALYVAQEFRDRTRDRKGITHQDALQVLLEWMRNGDGCFALILASFGTGKSFLLRELCQHMSKDPEYPIPLLIELRELGVKPTLDELIGSYLIRNHEPADAKKFRWMIRTGRIALLFDGFDELAQRVTFDRVKPHVRNVARSGWRERQGRCHQSHSALSHGQRHRDGADEAG